MNNEAAAEAPGQGVGGQDHRGGRVGRALVAGEVDLLGVDDAGPVVALFGAEGLGLAEQLEGEVLGPPDGQVGQEALAGLGRGDPRAVGHAADAAALQVEGVEAVVEVGPALVAADHPGEHRVVPVHRPAVLGGEGVGLVCAGCGRDDRATPPSRGARGPARRRWPTAQRRLWRDARRPGQQGEGPRCAVGVAGPEDLAPRGLQVEDEVDGPLDHAPGGLEEAPVLGQQPVVPDAGGHVGDGVGVELLLLDPVGQVVLVPGAVVPLGVDASQSKARSTSWWRPHTSRAMVASTWFHTSAWPPGNHGIIPVGSCHSAIDSAVSATCVGGQDAGDLGQPAGLRRHGHGPPGVAESVGDSTRRRSGACGRRARGSCPARAAAGARPPG